MEPSYYIVLIIDAVYISLSMAFLGERIRKNAAKYAIVALIFFVSLTALNLAFDDYQNSKIESYISLMILIVSYMILFKYNFFDAAFTLLFTYFVMAAFEIIMLLSLTPLGMGLQELVDNPLKLIIFELLKLIFVIIMVSLGVFRKLKPKVINIAPYITTSVLSIFIVMQLIRTITDMLVNGKSVSYEYIYILFIAMIAINVLLIRHVSKSEKERSQIKAYDKYEKMIIPLIENSRALEHDFKNHLLTLKGLAANENSKEFDDYLNSVNEELRANSVYKLCDNPVMGALMQEKSNYARNNQIEFDIDIYENQLSENNVKPHHMITVLSNLIDNAFEEVSKILDGTKKVSLKYKEKEHIEISVQNTLAAQSNKEIESIGKKQRYSSKGKSRGYGLINIKRIAKEYNGNLMVLHNQDSIEIKVILNPQLAE